jgi:hypothetical protein
MRRLLPLVALVLVASACGQQGAKPFLAAPTATCLREQGFRASTNDADVSLVFATAANGGLRAVPKGGGNTLEIGFASDGADAVNLQKAIRRVADPKLRPHLPDVMSSKRNAVLLWTVSPTPEQQQTVLGCLRT